MNNKEVLKQIRSNILEIAFKSNEGHIPSSFSILELIYVYYDIRLKQELDGVKINDKLIVSKGHAALGIFSILNHFGLLGKDSLDSFSSFFSPYGGHPDSTKVAEIEVSTGSLGHGLPIGVGMALASKIISEKAKYFVLVGDGELNEGSNWEAILLAPEHLLDNLILIIDNNHSGDRAIKLPGLKDKLCSFGWDTIEIDGHSLEDIYSAYMKAANPQNQRPLAIIANTIKGKGIVEMENSPEWHHQIPSEEKLQEWLKELK